MNKEVFIALIIFTVLASIINHYFRPNKSSLTPRQNSGQVNGVVDRNPPVPSVATSSSYPTQTINSFDGQ